MTEQDKREKLDVARRLIAEVNDAEKHDAMLVWRPWVIVRKIGP